MANIAKLQSDIQEQFADKINGAHLALGELTLDVKAEHLTSLCLSLRDHASFDFKMLIDVAGVDYLHYGLDDWATQSTTETGFSRGVCALKADEQFQGKKPYRFSVVYHLLSLSHNQRLRLHVNIPHGADVMVDSVIDIWQSADWFEREAFDLYGIIFRSHPDLRRLLTDYGFVGHPFRKDFPLIGKVEARYDQAQKRVVYEPVSIEMRVLEPKVIRHDNRYLDQTEHSDGK